MRFRGDCIFSQSPFTPALLRRAMGCRRIVSAIANCRGNFGRAIATFTMRHQHRQSESDQDNFGALMTTDCQPKLASMVVAR
jgi:hypothetical protein